MPYKDLKKRREASKLSMEKKRLGVNIGVNKTEGLTKYPAVLYALADIEKRAKLRAICQSLSNRGLLRNVRYGYLGPTMDIVSEYLTALT